MFFKFVYEIRGCREKAEFVNIVEEFIYFLLKILKFFAAESVIVDFLILLSSFSDGFDSSFFY